MTFIIVVLREGTFPAFCGCSLYRWIHQHSCNKLANYDEKCLVTLTKLPTSLICLSGKQLRVDQVCSYR